MMNLSFMLKMFLFILPAVSSVPEKLDLPSEGVQEHHASLPTREQALEAIQNVKLPSGVSLTGNVEPVKKVAKSSEQQQNDTDSNNEQYWGGLGGFGGLGGYGGFGPWRFGFSCGGLGGWAYPLGYWDAFGAGLYGSGCGLGFAWQSLYFC